MGTPPLERDEDFFLVLEDFTEEFDLLEFTDLWELEDLLELVLLFVLIELFVDAVTRRVAFVPVAPAGCHTISSDMSNAKNRPIELRLGIFLMTLFRTLFPAIAAPKGVAVYKD